ncbi:hypothetical protein FJT64_009132 [Amphibalanus amphitrite]|uniref:Uncharacterized protein n=1 Tax=Amphibalanus amphitrite TaxID=1232801 RepID=A0A6A4VMY4_AMPAM|nr:hypothetical protein FJT64_009132 [Amphibalanus amphitrite]
MHRIHRLRIHRIHGLGIHGIRIRNHVAMRMAVNDGLRLGMSLDIKHDIRELGRSRLGNNDNRLSDGHDRLLVHRVVDGFLDDGLVGRLLNSTVNIHILPTSQTSATSDCRDSSQSSQTRESADSADSAHSGDSFDSAKSSKTSQTAQTS